MSDSPPPEDSENVRQVKTRAGPKTAAGRNHFETIFKEALDGGQTEVRKAVLEAKKNLFKRAPVACLYSLM